MSQKISGKWKLYKCIKRKEFTHRFYNAQCLHALKLKHVYAYSDENTGSVGIGLENSMIYFWIYTVWLFDYLWFHFTVSFLALREKSNKKGES